MADQDKKPEMDFRLKLEIGYKDSNKGIIIADEYASMAKGLDMTFEINKSYESKPQASKLTIYNMNPSTYNKIYEQGYAFRLSCARGVNDDYTPFYTGYAIRSTQVGKDTLLSSNEGFMKQDANAGRRGQNDLETNITLMNFNFATLYKSYQAGVSTELIINDCIEAIDLPKGNIDTWTNTTLPAGYTIRGNVSEALDDLGNRLGFNWNVNDMKFNIYSKDRDDLKLYGIKLTPYNSSTPERQADKTKKVTTVIQKANKKKGLKGIKRTDVIKVPMGFKIKTQLLPFLQVGSTCYLSEAFMMSGAAGNKYIYKIRHVGSNTGTECYTEIWCC